MITLDKITIFKIMFGPLNFALKNDSTSGARQDHATESNSECPCLGCNDTFNICLCFDVFVKHMFEAHQLVVEDIQTIANIPEYMRWWRSKLNGREINCGLIPEVNMGTDGKYYFLSPLLKDDRMVRQRFQLEKVLRTQEIERTDGNYCKECLFCRLQFEGTRLGYIEHLYGQHNLILGKVQNLVYIEELVQQLEQRLTALQCIYCEKTFPDRAVLKEHMRKKGHKRIRAQDKDYDRFYVVNYVPKESSPVQQQRTPEEESTGVDENCDEEYADWVADSNESDHITCLFCSERTANLQDIERHLLDVHHFHLKEVMEDLGEHYIRVKVVNYLRKQIFQRTCPCCGEACETAPLLQEHLSSKQHCRLPDDRKLYDRPEYFFSTYEDDALLYLIVDPDPDVLDMLDKIRDIDQCVDTVAQLVESTALL